MSLGAPEPDRERRPEGNDPATLYGVSPEIVAKVREALDQGKLDQIEKLAEQLHAADFADLLQELTGDERKLVIAAARHIIEPETLNYLDEAVREEVIELMGPGEVAQAVSELETDDAVEILEDLDAAEQQQILEAIPAEERAVIEQGLTYPEDSAGRLMQRDLVAVPQHWTVGETIDYLRANQELPDDFYDLFVVDPTHKPIGAVSLSRAMRNERTVKLVDIMETEFRVVPVTMDQESVAHLFRQYGLVSAPVVDENGRLLGVVTVDDVVHVIEEEAEEDLLGIVGVSETDFHAPPLETAWRRVRWLVVTLCNSAIASTVILQFEATIEQIVALAVLMPIVAAMGGNAGVQVITVMVRALATRDLQPRGSNIWRVVGKEIAVAGINATVFAVIMGAVASFFFGLPIGLVLGAAMIFNMVWAGIAGTVIPLTLARFGIDPAIGAGPFLTTTTDVFGFFSFLGLATLFLL
ncbi:MAG: magnesium transporter [Pseudomonadota bacterium]